MTLKKSASLRKVRESKHVQPSGNENIIGSRIWNIDATYNRLSQPRHSSLSNLLVDVLHNRAHHLEMLFVTTDSDILSLLAFHHDETWDILGVSNLGYLRSLMIPLWSLMINVYWWMLLMNLWITLIYDWGWWRNKRQRFTAGPRKGRDSQQALLTLK